MGTEEEQPKKEVRKRKKRLVNLLQQQLEFYFGDANLRHDRFLRKEIEGSQDGYIELSLMLKFNKLSKLTTDMKLLSKAVKNSELLELNEDESKLKRIEKLPELKNTDSQTVYVDQLIGYCDHDWLRNVFSACGTIDYISLPRYKDNGKIKGFAFIEFSSKEGAEKACQMFSHSTARKNKNKKRHSSSESKSIEDKKEKRKRRRSSSFTETETESKGSKKVRKRSSSVSLDTTPIADKNNDKFNSPKENRNRENKIEIKGAFIESKENIDPPVKLKKKSVTLIEESLSQENENSQKKLKRKKSKSSEVEEEIKPKKATLEATENISSDIEVSHSNDEGVESIEKKKKHRKHRKRKDSEVKEVSLPSLYVIPKGEWLTLKKQYKTLQRKEMRQLKRTTRILKSERVKQAELKHQKQEKEKLVDEEEIKTDIAVTAPKEKTSIKLDETASQDFQNKLSITERETKTTISSGNSLKAPKQLQMKPGTVMSFTTSSEHLNKKLIKDDLSKVVEVSYVDYINGDTKGYIRFSSQESVEKLSKDTLQTLEFKLARLSEAEETEYFRKALEDQKKRYEQNETKKKKKKERGYDKVLRTSQNHIKFE